MLPSHSDKFPSRGSAGRRPASMAGTRAQAMLPPPPPGPDLGAFEGNGPPVQDVVGALVRELRTSLLDIGTAVRLGFTSRSTYQGTTLPPMQNFTAPSNVNDPNSVLAGVQQAGAATRALNKTASSGEAQPAPKRIARSLPRRKM